MGDSRGARKKVKKPRGARLPRPRAEIVQALRDHLRLLEVYMKRAFDDGDEAYLGEVAAKLRLLSVSAGMNKALLLDVIDALGFRYEITWRQWDEKRGQLRDYMTTTVVMHRLASGEMAEFTAAEFVSSWAQQNGGAHEDWEHDEALRLVLSPDVIIGDVPAPVRILRGIARTVHHVGSIFLASLDARLATGWTFE